MINFAKEILSDKEKEIEEHLKTIHEQNIAYIDLFQENEKEILSDKEKEIEELHRELEDYTFNYPDFKTENEQLKADLEHHKQSELATGKLLLAEKQKNEQLKAEWQKKSDTNHELIEQLVDSNETIADLKAQIEKIDYAVKNGMLLFDADMDNYLLEYDKGKLDWDSFEDAIDKCIIRNYEQVKKEN